MIDELTHIILHLKRGKFVLLEVTRQQEIRKERRSLRTSYFDFFKEIQPIEN